MMTEDPNQTIQTVAEATKSVADAAHSGVELAEKALRWLAKMLGEDAAGLMKDAMFYFRAKNAIALQQKLDRILKERRMENPKVIPLRLAIPFLEAATLEDDSTLQERWVRLLANAMDPNVHIQMERYFGSILDDLTPVDCLVVEQMAEMTQAERDRQITIEGLAESLGLESRAVDMSFCSLSRQSIIERKPKAGADVTSISSWLYKNSAFYLTEFGKEFVRACSGTPGKWTLGGAAGDSKDPGQLNNQARWEPYHGE